MTPIEWMLRTYQPYENLSLWVVAMPLPPLQVRGLIYMPDCYASRAFDAEPAVDMAGVEHRVITIAPSSWGPAILMRVQFKKLISYSSDGLLSTHANSCCATVCYRIKHNVRVGPPGLEKKMDVAADVTIDHVNFSSSCNPGSHIVVPQSPFLTALLQYAKAPQEEIAWQGLSTRVPYLDPWEVMNIFPMIDTTTNRHVDQYVGQCAIDQKIHRHSSLASLGEWSVPYLRQMRINQILMEDPEYGTKRFSIVGHPSQENGRSLRPCPIGGGADSELRQEGHNSQRGYSPQDYPGSVGIPIIQGTVGVQATHSPVTPIITTGATSPGGAIGEANPA